MDRWYRGVKMAADRWCVKTMLMVVVMTPVMKTVVPKTMVVAEEWHQGPRTMAVVME